MANPADGSRDEPGLGNPLHQFNCLGRRPALLSYRSQYKLFSLKPSPETESLRRAGIWGAGLSALFGIALWHIPGVSDWSKAFSFDALSAVRPSTLVSDVVIVAIDEESHTRLGQRPPLWDRSLHTRLLDTLMARGARAVVFDILFAEEWPDPEVDVRLAEALQSATGKVVLAASL